MAGTCLRVRAIAAAFAVATVAGCSADVARLDADPFVRAMQGGDSPVSLTGALPRVTPGPELRPKADLLAGVRPPATTGRRDTVVRVASLGDVPVRIPPQDAVPRAAAARSAGASPRKEAKGKQKSLATTTRRSPTPVAHKAATRGPVRVAAPRAHETGTRRPLEVRVAASSATFDWPVHGAIVARFGAQGDGPHNSGIAIAVAEDTPIKAAEDGVVIYSGSGLKSFGNLVIVRHADSYVTAYGHAKELTVARGDTVKRGDIIGRSGQTGEASTPRVHFEIRKDSVPVDPMRLLKPGSASL